MPVIIKKIILPFLLFVASAVLLTVIQPPLHFAYLAWIAIVPFMLACSHDTKAWQLAIISYIAGVGYWLGNLYFLLPVTIGGWIVLCLYLGVLWPGLAISIRYCRAKKIPLFIVAAIIFTGAERLQGFFLGGFFWRFLAHSQFENTTLIQIADIFGAAGVSFLVAMANGLVADLLSSALEKTFYKSLYYQTAIVFTVLGGIILYGQFRIQQYEKIVKDGPIVGSVQTAMPQTVKDSGSPEINRANFNAILADSNAVKDAGAQLIVWPETIVPAILDDRVLMWVEPNSQYLDYDKRLKTHSKDRCCLLVGAIGGTTTIKDDEILLASRFNCAFLYKPDGTKADEKYCKIHLVPFGEYIPFKSKLPWLHDFLMKLTPYDYDYTIDPGSDYTIFHMPVDSNKPEKTYKFAVMICYEDSVPYIAREFALNQNGEKQIHWLVNISNDGWFVTTQDGKIIPSAELPQHASVCVFRAVENRLAVIRSVNTGISCLIDPLGRLRNTFLSGTLPKTALDRKGMTGWFVDKMPIDNRVTVFSRYGQWLDTYCAVIFAAIFAIAATTVKTKAKKE